jgi:hypothetical protein
MSVLPRMTRAARPPAAVRLLLGTPTATAGGRAG